MYTNISITYVQKIIQTSLHNNNIGKQTNNEIISLDSNIIVQNYLQFESKYYKQKDGLAMGAPTSAILSELSTIYGTH
jgi:hypothetical protein